MRWCPQQDCNLAIKADQPPTYRQNCQCRCGLKLCFKCGAEPHDPISCDMISVLKAAWENTRTRGYTTKNIPYQRDQKTQAPKATSVMAESRCCPHCNSRNVKNLGTNRVVCLFHTIYV